MALRDATSTDLEQDSFPPPTPPYKLRPIPSGNTRYTATAKQRDSVYYMGNHFCHLKTQVLQERQESNESIFCNKDGTHCISREKPGEKDDLENSTHLLSHPACPWWCGLTHFGEVAGGGGMLVSLLNFFSGMLDPFMLLYQNRRKHDGKGLNGQRIQWGKGCVCL